MNETTRPAGLLTIGAFAAETRLSLKALRLYDHLGLLHPAYTDPESGYRYYHSEQSGRARLIGLLRRLDMPLTRIAEVIDLSGHEAATALRRYWAEVETESRVRRELVRYLEGQLSGTREESMYDIRIRQQPEQKVASIQRAVHVRDLDGFIRSAFGTLQGTLAASGRPFAGEPFVIYHGRVDEDSDGPVEVCVPFEGAAVEPHGEVRVRVEPARREAYTTITRDQAEFPRILEAYDAVAAWVGREGLTRTAAPREVYLAGPDEVGADDPLCDIAFPVV